MSSKHVVSKGAKNFLKNTIQSTDFHNRKKEEEMMWKIHQEQSHGIKRELSNKSDPDSEDSDQNKHSNNFGGKKYWMKKLAKEEEKQPERWGHSGYKELYPEEFDESSSDHDEKKPEKPKTKPNRKKKKKSKKNKHKRKKSK